MQNLYCRSIHTVNQFRGYAPQDAIIICGSGRSGTTWLAEIFEGLKGATLLDEPLKRPDSKRIQRMGFSGSGQYIPQGTKDWPEAKKFFEELLTGREFNPNHLHGKMHGLWTTKYWVLKFIRAHYLLPWLVDEFPLRKPIYLIRNPYAVVSSQLKHRAWTHTQVKYTIPKTRFNSYFEQFEPIYAAIKNNVQFKVFNWALENSFLLNHAYHQKKWLMIKYEDLVETPNETLGFIFTELNLPANQNFRPAISKISNSTRDGAGEIGMTDKWKKHLKSSEIDDISEVLEKFNLLQWMP